MTLKQQQDRLDVLQGTLDMLILQTLQWGPQHGLRIAQGFARNPRSCCGSKPAPSIRRSTGWNSRAG